MSNLFFAVGIVILLYLEPLSFLGVKFSHLWKICVLYSVAIALLLVLKKYRLNIISVISRFAFLKYGFVYSLIPIIGSVGYISPSEDIFIGIQRLFVFMTVLFLMLYPFKYFDRGKVFKYITVATTFSFIPFYFQWLPNLGKSVELSKFGGDGSSLVGIFQNPHAASLALTLVLMYNVFYILISKSKATALLYSSIGSLNCMFLFMVAVRSGLISAIAGLFAILIGMKVNIKLITLLVGLLMFLVAIYQFGVIDSSLQNRLMGQNVYSKEHDIDTISSGRISIWKTSLKIYSDATIREKMFGMGIVNFKAKMQLFIGSNIFAHNGFINELCVHGLAGLVVFVVFLHGCFIDIKRMSNSSLRPLAYALFINFVTFTIFQSADYPLHFVLMIFPMIYSYLQYSSCRRFTYCKDKKRLNSLNTIKVN